MIQIRWIAVRDIGNSIKVYMFPNEFHKSLTALPHVSVIIQSEAGVISISVSIFNFISDVPCEHVAYRKQITGVGMISSFPAFIL